MQVAERIREVSGPACHSLTSGEATSLVRASGSEVAQPPRNLEEAVMLCEGAASSLTDCFNSHQATKLRVEEMEVACSTEREARQRLESKAQRFDEVEEQAAEERQARKQLEAKARLAKNDCTRLAERLSALSGVPQTGVSAAGLEDALASCEVAYVKLEAALTEERRARRELEAEKRTSQVEAERSVAKVRCELSQARTEAARERELRKSMEESILRSSTTARTMSFTPGGSSSSDLPDNERTLYQPPVHTPRRMDAVGEHRAPTSSMCRRYGSRSGESRANACKSACCVM